MQNCVTQLAEIEKESLKTVRFVDTKYFKQLSDEISSFELVQAKDPENTQIIADIITIYKTMIQNGTNLLVREINTPHSIITNNLIETWFDQVEILRPYKEQVNDALTEAKTRAKTPPLHLSSLELKQSQHRPKYHKDLLNQKQQGPYIKKYLLQ